MISTTTTTSPTTPPLTHQDVPRCRPGMTFANRYAIEAEVGAGAEARVFSALDLDQMPPQRVAIKVAHERHRPKSRRSLHREAVQMRRLQAVIGIVQVIASEVCEHQGFAFVVREFVDGPSLRELFAMRGKLDAAEVIHIGRSLARTLAQSHAMGVQLRDLKPDNVILRGGSEPVIIDLGGATAEDTATTGTDPTRPFMTPAYASPEQLAGKNAGMASDIYALGVILCEMASGRLPFPGVVDLRGITRPIATIARACLAHDPAKRPTAEQLVNAFTAANVRWMRRQWLEVTLLLILGIVAGGIALRHFLDGRLVLETLASEQFNPQLIAVEGDHLYWTGSKFRRVMHLGPGASNPELLTPGEPLVHGLAIAPGVVYWNEGPRIVRWMGTGAPVEIGQSRNTPSRLVADARGLYWTESQSGNVMAFEQPFHGALRTLAQGQDRPEGIVLDDDAVYWTNHGGQVMRTDRTETGAAQVLAERQAEPAGIAVDDENVYWANERTGTVMTVPKRGGLARVLVHSKPGIRELAVDEAHVYWTSMDEGFVLRVPKAGGAPELLATGQVRPYGVALDARAVYWVTDTERGTVMRVGK